MKALPPLELLNTRLRYEPETGKLYWRKGGNGVRRNQEAGCINPRGYRVIKINDSSYQAHRLIIKMITGEEPQGVIDHIDHNRLNNRMENLRVGSQSDNMQNLNRTARSTTSGYPNVYIKSGGYCQAAVTVNGVTKTKSFLDTELANAWAITTRQNLQAQSK